MSGDPIRADTGTGTGTDTDTDDRIDDRIDVDEHPEGPVMYLLEHQLADCRMQELRVEAMAASRARRLYLARRAARRAELAVRRAARASASVY